MWGCGSGILSIIGLMLGANEASATDIDPLAVEAFIDNAKINGINLACPTMWPRGDLITQDVLKAIHRVQKFRHGCGRYSCGYYYTLSAGSRIT